MSSVARSQYNALQLSFRKRWSHGYQFDVNYTLAHAMDHGSAVERGSFFTTFDNGGYTGFLINTWNPDQQYADADFDIRHQINVNWVTELPVRPRQEDRQGRQRLRQRVHRRLVGGGVVAMDQRLPVQRPELPVVLGHELEPPGQRLARESRVASVPGHHEGQGQRPAEPVHGPDGRDRGLPARLPG
jgi:hypothetical protein